MGSHDVVDHGTVDHDTVPPARKGLLVAAGVLLALPVVALLGVDRSSTVKPKLGAFPCCIWYQVLWVFLCSALTYTAYRLVLAARPHRPMTDLEDGAAPRSDAPAGGER